jgi:ABC-type transport system involved in cytochrome bd biosynthesis fused ATPase/permease subunit
MEEDAKTRFKWKFYRLTIELNIIILLVAMSIIVFFIFHSPYSVPIIIGMLILALIISLDFYKKYKETKKWLDEQKGKDNKNEGTGEKSTE